MRVLHLTTFLQGGAGRVIVELAREQQKQGHDVTVVASRDGAPGYDNYAEYLDSLTSCGITTRLVRSTFERSHAGTVAAVSAIERLLPAGRTPDVIHAHAAVPSLIGLLYAGVRRAPVRVVQTMHGWGQTKTDEQATTDVGVLNLVDRVAVPSTASATLLAGLGVRQAQVEIVPYGVATTAPALDASDEATWMTMTRARRAGRLVIACVGTIGPRKNQTLLVEAIAQSKEIDALCVFIGDGDSRPLRQAVQHFACGDRVHLHGYSRTARTLAAGADLLVLPSRSEGQPISILEAFSDGLLVAVSDIPELGELVDDRVNGFRFRSEDARSLAGVLARVAALSNSDRRSMRAASRARFAAHFTLDRMVERYAALYTGAERRTPQSRRRLTRSAA